MPRSRTTSPPPAVELAAAPPGSVPGDVTRALARLIAVLLRDEPGPEQPATPAEASP